MAARLSDFLVIPCFRIAAWPAAGALTKNLHNRKLDLYRKQVENMSNGHCAKIRYGKWCYKVPAAFQSPLIFTFSIIEVLHCKIIFLSIFRCSTKTNFQHPARIPRQYLSCNLQLYWISNHTQSANRAWLYVSVI